MESYFAPRLPVSKHTKKLMEKIMPQAEALLKTPAASLPYSAYELYHKTGNRTEYEAHYAKHRERLCAFAAMALYTDEEQWYSALTDAIWAILDEFTWALPAHIDAGATVAESQTVLDLFSCETAFALSDVLHLTKQKLPQFVVERAKAEIIERVITPFVTAAPRWPQNNWQAVCAGSVACAVIYTGQEHVWQATEGRLVAHLKSFLDTFYDDGCCLEGPLYWQYGFGYFVYAADMIKHYTKGRIDLLQSEKVHRIAAFAQNIVLAGNTVLPFSDSCHNLKFHIGLLHRLKQIFPDLASPDERYESTFGDDLRFRFCDFIRDFYWYDDALKDAKPTSRSHFFEDAGWYIARQKHFVFAAKGGHNDEPHNHCDLGHFVLFSGGKFIFDDLGWPEYYNGYFGEKRKEDLCAASRGHSVPLINDTQQAWGKDFCANVLSATDTGFRLGLARAYDIKSLTSFQRSFTVSDSALLITDTFSGTFTAIRERFVTRIEPVMLGNGVVKIDTFTLVCNAPCDVFVEKETFMPRNSICKSGMKDVETAYLIDFQLKDISHGTTVTFVAEKTI